MVQGTNKRPIERNTNKIAKTASTSLLKSNNINALSLSSNNPPESLYSSTPNVYLIEKPMYTSPLANVPTVKSLPLYNNPSKKIHTSTLPPGTSLLKTSLRALPSVPTPKNPIQFQKLGEIDGLDTKKTVSALAPTPSGINLTTAHHVNRSVIYLEPVSTKGTAPTNNFIKISTNDIDTNNTIQPNTVYPLEQYSSIKASKLNVFSANKSLLKQNCNESVNTASFNSSYTNNTHLEEIIDAPITNLDINIHGNNQQAVPTEYLEQVSNKLVNEHSSNIYTVLFRHDAVYVCYKLS